MENKIDTLVEFVYDGVKYILCTDNSHNEFGELNVYSMGVDENGKYFEPTDVDLELVNKAMLESYKSKVMDGEL